MLLLGRVINQREHHEVCYLRFVRGTIFLHLIFVQLDFSSNCFNKVTFCASDASSMMQKNVILFLLCVGFFL